MNLYTICTSCKESIKIKSDAGIRPQLQMEKGDKFKVNCLKCGKFDKIHVNDVRAEINKFPVLIGVIIGLIVSGFLFFNYGIVGTFGIMIPILFWQQQMNTVKSFNSYTIRRK